MRIIFTGGSGEAGRHILPLLLDAGHDILNLDLAPLPAPLGSKIHTIRTDLTDAGQVFNGLLSHSRIEQPFKGPPAPVEAVIHFAGVARNMMVPDSELWRTNLCATFNVVDAACKLGIRKIIMASSICVYGTVYAQGDLEWASLPVTEATACRPTDPYSIGKLACENLCEGYARKFGNDIYALRIGHIVAPETYQGVFNEYLSNPDQAKVQGWSYVDVRDLAQICDRCLRTDSLGWQTFLAVNDEATIYGDITKMAEKAYPKVQLTEFLTQGLSLIRNHKAKRLLGFKPKYSWHEEYQGSGVP